MRVPSFASLGRAAALGLTLAAAGGTAGCTDAYGRTDWGSTLALGAGIGLAAGAVAALASDGGGRSRQTSGWDRGYSSRGRGYAQGYGQGYGPGYAPSPYGRPYGGWR